MTFSLLWVTTTSNSSIVNVSRTLYMPVWHCQFFLKEQYTTLKDKYAKLYVSWVFEFRVKRPHFINAHRKMMVVYLACLVCRRAPSRGEATWPLCMNTCRAAVKSWYICQGSRRGSCRETGAISCLTLPASAWSMRWATPDDELTADDFI